MKLFSLGHKKLLTLILASLALSSLNTVFAQEVLPSSPTIEKFRKTGKVVMGVRESSIPLSYLVGQTPMGYGVDICTILINNIKRDYNLPNLQINYQLVTSLDRIDKTKDGLVDLECGSTTNNADRRKDVAFTIPYYISGVRILSRTESGITKLNDLRGKTISLGKGTTSIKLMNKINTERAMNIKTIETPTFSEALQQVAKKNADAFILDDLLLFSELSKVSNPKDFQVVGEFLSVEPIAIMIRKDDPAFQNYLNKQMNTMIKTGYIDILYKKWFQSPIPPNNNNLNIPQSSLLKDVFRFPTDIVGN